MMVALFHEFLTQFGGAEQILKTIHEMFPDAPIFVLVKDDDIVKEHFPRATIVPSFVQRLPGWYKQYLVLMPWAVESFDLSGYDLVISDSSAFAKGAMTKPPGRHISYIHTPTRYLWGETSFYIDTVVPSLLRPLLWFFVPWLRSWDCRAAQRPDVLIANSKEVQKRIKKYYGRTSILIHPFVDDRHFTARKAKRQDFYLMSGRIVPYKRYDIVVKAFKQMPDKRLLIAGDGYELAALKRTADKAPNITFLGRVSDAELSRLYSTAKGYIFSALEDFGIVALEAMAHGTPVICYGRGGSLETVADGTTGVYFDQQTSQAVRMAIERFERLERAGRFRTAVLRSHALKFRKKKFMLELRKVIKTYGTA